MGWETEMESMESSASTPNAGVEGRVPGGRACPRGGIAGTLANHTIYPNRINSVSRIESKSFRRHILESNAGGKGVSGIRPIGKCQPRPFRQQPSAERISVAVVIARQKVDVYLSYAACSRSRYDRLRAG